ncbi:MAG: hypothetical protein OXI12_10195 [Gammaproteobacteria bacterium]|nr:hypothetical protein [Gammaproteobacteria bacterium]
MDKIKHAAEAILFAAVLAGLDEAGTVDISEVFGLSGETGALVTGIVALCLTYAQRWVKAQLEAAEAGE